MKEKDVWTWTEENEATYQRLYTHRMNYFAQRHSAVVDVLEIFMSDGEEVVVNDVAVNLEKYAKVMMEALRPYAEEKK